VALYKRQFGALQFIILVMLVLSVASTVNMVVYERTGEFGTLLALGLKRRQIFRLVLLENTLLGLVGGVLGVLRGSAGHGDFGTLACRCRRRPAPTRVYASIRIVPVDIGPGRPDRRGCGFAGGIATGRRASRLAVVDALRHNI
jgi:putative ABC transport system permease protein